MKNLILILLVIIIASCSDVQEKQSTKLECKKDFKLITNKELTQQEKKMLEKGISMESIKRRKYISAKAMENGTTSQRVEWNVSKVNVYKNGKVVKTYLDTLERKLPKGFVIIVSKDKKCCTTIPPKNVERNKQKIAEAEKEGRVIRY